MSTAIKSGRTLEENEDYKIVLSGDETAILLAWSATPGLSGARFAEGITAVAAASVEHSPTKVVIDARNLDSFSEAVGWLRGQRAVSGFKSYMEWWTETIVPLYDKSGMDSLSVATGDPEAPGEIPAPEGSNFRIAYVEDLLTASTWVSA